MKATAGAKVPQVEQIDENHFKIAVKEPARNGKANDAIRKVLARFFRVSQSAVMLKSGTKSKTKLFILQE